MERLDDPILASRLLRSRIPRVRLLLNELLVIPDQMVVPRSGSRRGMTVNHRQVHALGLASSKLIFQSGLSLRSCGKYDQARRVAIDAVHHQRPALPFERRYGMSSS